MLDQVDHAEPAVLVGGGRLQAPRIVGWIPPDTTPPRIWVDTDWTPYEGFRHHHHVCIGRRDTTLGPAFVYLLADGGNKIPDPNLELPDDFPDTPAYDEYDPRAGYR